MITQEEIEAHGSAFAAFGALDWEDVGTVMSNCDGAIEEEIVELVDRGEAYAQYAGWNFCGYVWRDVDGYACEVWVHRAPREVVREGTLREIMESVSERYGHD